MKEKGHKSFYSKKQTNKTQAIEAGQPAQGDWELETKQGFD